MIDKIERLTAYETDLRNELWKKFVLSGKPAALAELIEECGTDEQSIAAVIHILKNGAALSNKGGKDMCRDLETYTEVNLLIRAANISRIRWELLDSTERAQNKPKSLSKSAACGLYAIEMNLEKRTVEKQYERGKKIFKSENDRG